MSELVTCKLAGGLGNWMFQIAACYHVNKTLEKKVVIDTSDIATVHSPLSDYEDNIFRKVEFSNSFDSDYHINLDGFPMEFMQIPNEKGNLKMQGYFQNENYVNHIRDKILDLFEIDNDTLDFLRKKYSFISDSNTCSIHVRRGNYIERQNVHYVQPFEYYMRCLNDFNLQTTHFIIFSDDLDWCREKFSFLPNKTFISGNKDYQDLYLMSMCKNNIIANSSFSWWGAWLNKNQNKKVYYPSMWFNPLFMRPQKYRIKKLDKKIMRKYLITGSNGLVGNSLKNKLGEGHVYHTKEDVDLLDFKKTKDFIEYNIKHNGVDSIIHCAAKVGGVQANMKNNKLFFYENFVMNNNLMQICFENELPNFVNLLSTCIFPDKGVKYPLEPSQINNGAPHFSNHGYSYAKRLSGIQTDYIKNVLKNNWISIIPTNVYGKNDNFHLDFGHMVPAMIHRAYLSKKNNEKMVIWGDGSPLRQVIYSEDLANLILWALDNWKSDSPFMAVNPKEYSILQIGKEICSNYGILDDDLIFDSTKPMGQAKKPAITNAPETFEFTPLEVGIKKTIDWFLENYNTLRK